jgi:hypothetical protein
VAAHDRRNRNAVSPASGGARSRTGSRRLPQTRKRLKRNLQAKRSKLERKAWRGRRDKSRLTFLRAVTLSCAGACNRGYLRPFGRTIGAVFAGPVLPRRPRRRSPALLPPAKMRPKILNHILNRAASSFFSNSE